MAAIRAHPDRLFDMTVCLRPFRAAGPRLDVEQIGDARVAHNYGHGGSGWSLSWGSADLADAQTGGPEPAPPGALTFAGYRDRIRDLTPRGEDLPAVATPFPVARARRSETLMFNVADLCHTLMSDFFAAGGGVFVHREFHTPAELADLPQKVVINCPGLRRAGAVG